MMVVNLNFGKASKRVMSWSFYCLSGILNEGLETGNWNRISKNKKRLSVPV